MAYLLAALSIRLSVLILDSHIRFMLGDSESYLSTGFHRWIPNDRSWIYGLVINALVAGTHSLTSLVLLQSGISAVMCAWVAMFCRWLGVRKSIAWLALLAVSIDPLLLYYDRSIMTDQLATVAIWTAIALSTLALARGTLALAFGAVVCFCAATVLRTALEPLVIAVPIMILVVVITRFRRETALSSKLPYGAGYRPLVVASVLVLGVIVGSASYAIVTGTLTGSRASLNPRSGYFLIGVVAPILAADDFEGSRVSDMSRVLEESHHTRRELRNAQVFAPDGIALRLEATLGDWREVSRVGTLAARRAVLRDPFGFAGLVAANVRDYLTPAAYRERFHVAFGLDRELSVRTVQMLQPMVYERVSPDMPKQPSALLGWIAVTVWSLPVVTALALLLPGCALTISLGMNRDVRDAVQILSLSVWIYVASVFGLSPEVVARYLLPLSPTLVVLIAVEAEFFYSRLSSRQMTRPV